MKARKFFRTSEVSVAAAIALISVSTHAYALEYQFGDVQVFVDSTVSAGASVKTQKREHRLLPEVNGGPIDPRGSSPLATPFAGLPITGGANPLAPANTVTFTDNVPDVFSGSINSDDGRLNFNRGDLISGNVKMTNDIQANWQNYTLFARLNSFYDAVLDNSSSFERNGLDISSKVDAARDVDLLDFYVSADYALGELPLNVRLGKQVISWGEGTFILNGINAVNPIDVAAFRRPGAEIKEGLVPVWALYGSIGLPNDLSVEVFYQLAWDDFKLDRSGTPFAGSDVANPNMSFGGNQGRSFNGGGIFGGTFRRNCTGSPAAALALSGALGPAVAAAFPTAGCLNGSPVDFDVPLLTNGTGEQQNIALGNLDFNSRLTDREARDSGQYGVALRWYAEELNSTEFGFYFMNYHSRLPIAQIEVTGRPVAHLSVQTASGSSGSRALSSVGCVGGNGTSGLLIGGAFVDPALALSPNNPLLVNNTIDDPNGLFTSLAPYADAVLGLGNTIQNNVATVGANHVAGALINCALVATQQATTPASPLPFVVDGAETLAIQRSAGLRLIYPEDIQLFGASFNTTVGDWGVQGEVSFRHDQPLQVDTTQQVIAASALSCTALVSNGDAAAAILSPLTTFANPIPPGVTGCDADLFFDATRGGPGTRQPDSFVREEVITGQIGTTATYSNSNELVGALGADLGILLTELGGVYVPDVASALDTSGYSLANPAPRGPRLANVCVSGSQFPLGALVGLKNASGCEPNIFSYGYVLVGILQYNNAFGTPWTLSPSVSLSHDVKGNTPAPLSNYREGSKRISLGLSASYQNSISTSLSYTNNFGGEKYNGSTDQDFLSFNVRYSF